MFWTRAGWIVPVIWLGSFVLAGQVAQDWVGRYGMGLTHTAFLAFLTAALATPALWLSAAVLNRRKVPTTIRPLGRERVVMWGTHTFYLLPLGGWAAIVPVTTVTTWLVHQVL